VADFAGQKFCQIANIHAEAYPSAEFRHGPLSMLDEDEKTAGKFFLVNFIFFSNFSRIG
jgi:glucosamine 6-phosphate synthetase-like amidotransferase/phosphosugar isomerase protein